MQESTYLLILGYFIFQRTLQANGFAFELIKGLRHVTVVVIDVIVVVDYCCFAIVRVVLIDDGIAGVASRRQSGTRS